MPIALVIEYLHKAVTNNIAKHYKENSSYQYFIEPLFISRCHHGQFPIPNNMPAIHNPRGKKRPKPNPPHSINSLKQHFQKAQLFVNKRSWASQ